MTIVYLLDSLIDINIDADKHHACNGLVGIPLPCSRDLWEATSYSAWEVEYRLYLATRDKRKILLYADLVEALRLQRNEMSKQHIDELDSWCTGLDGLGTLVLTAALTA